MALPDLSGVYGPCLFRRSPSTGERWFIQRVRGNLDVVIDIPGPGTWTYELAIVDGAASSVASVDMIGEATLILENLKR